MSSTLTLILFAIGIILAILLAISLIALFVALAIKALRKK